MIRIDTHDAKSLSLAPAQDQTLAQAIFLAGLWDGVPLCAGLGRCGLCRVRFVFEPPEPAAEDVKRLGRAEVDAGWRLSCLHPAVACHVELPEPKRSARPRSAVSKSATGTASTLAVDLGTTSIHWAALDTAGETLSTGQGLNPQMGLGSEVMSRLAYAAKPGGLDTLSGLVRARLAELVRGAEARHGGTISRLCVAGNSAMTALLLGLGDEAISGLSRAPYRLDYAGGEERRISPDLPPALIPPLLAPFVGADLSAGLAALTFAPGGPPAYPCLLADLGTNGEFVLALSEHEYLLASVPLGPALEGVGLRHGRVAAPGAVRAFALTPVGLRPDYIERTPLPAEDPGITGVGYLSLLATLLRAGVLDESGRFVVPATPLGKRLAKALVNLGPTGGEPALNLGHGLLLPASDVEELVKVKAAFNLALSRLLTEAGLAAGALQSVHLAGAVGEHADLDDLAELGFLPQALTGRVARAGNTSLTGARLLLTRPDAWDWVRALSGKCRALDLASEPEFGSLYVERMVLRHVS